MNNLTAKLEYTQIIQIIKQYCNTYLGKKLVNNLLPCFSFEEVKLSLAKTEQAMILLYKKGTAPFSELAEMEPYFKILESKQALNMKGLLSIAHFLDMCANLRHYFYGDTTIDISEFPLLEDYFSSLYTNPSIIKNITQKILDENTMADDASSKLSALRKDERKIEDQIKEKLLGYIHSSTYTKYLQDPIITIRNDRYVIPVKEEYREQLKGFLHDTSSSGSTLYIEPMSIFEYNNKLNHLKLEEELEIENILQSLSSYIEPFLPELKENLNAISALDLLFAKASYGKAEDYIIPKLNEEKKICLFHAKHPLLNKNTAVPVDITLGEDYKCLLITGPNTGGKTVLLKTIGLLMLMAYSGIPIPCYEKSSIYVFNNLFVDIGDEQSIEQSLSTFSAHMTNIISIVQNANENSLILLDELGSGTDPIEGSALAISILNFLHEKGSLVCATTHYPELKEFALVTDGFENASFEFDIENLKPTYHLLIGIPGKSNAFEISQKLGLSKTILENAKQFLKKDKVSIEELLKNIYDQQVIIENEKEETDKNLSEVANLRELLEKQTKELEDKKKDLIDKAKLEARQIIFDAKDEVNDMIRKLEQKNADLKTANKIRNNLNEKVKHLSSEALSSTLNDEPLSSEDIKEGAVIWVPSLHDTGTILGSSVHKSKVLVQVGTAKMNLDISKLAKLPSSMKNEVNKNSKASFNQKSQVKVSASSKASLVTTEINVIGQNVEEAISVIDKYIDNCIMAHISPIRIVHGKGTGKLRSRCSAIFEKAPSCAKL